MGRNYKLHWDKRNKVWSQYITNPYTKKRTKVVLGKATSRTNDPKAYAKALHHWNRIKFSGLGTAYQEPTPSAPTKPRKGPNYRHLDSLLGLFDRYLQYQTEQFTNGTIAASTLRNRKHHTLYFLNSFIKHQANDNTTSNSGGAPKIVRPSLIINYYRHLSNMVGKGQIQRSTAALRFNTFKHFLRYACYKNNSLNLPANLDSKEYAFRRTRAERYITKSPIVFTRAEVNAVLETCLNSKFHNQVALWVSLSLNCGFTIADLATLQIQHIQKGPHFSSIIKPRLKTAVRGEWRLWDENTQALNSYIKKHFINPKPEQLIFLSKHGQPIFEWIEEKDDNGKTKITSRNRSYSSWRKAFNKAGVNKAFRYLRKTTGSAMEELVPDHRFVQRHLAHQPKTLAGQVYSTGISQEALDGYILDLPQFLGIELQIQRLSRVFN